MTHHLQRDSFEQARATLKSQIITSLRHRNGHTSPTIKTLSATLDPISPLAWLRAHPQAPRVYWSGREDGFEYAGIGVADGHSEPYARDLSILRDQLDPPLSTCEPGVRYYGGIRFDLRLPYEPHWRTFGAWRFVLPRFELRRSPTHAELRCNLRLPDDYARVDQIVYELSALANSRVKRPVQLPIPLSVTYRPSRIEWQEIIEDMLATIEQSSLGKIVVARETLVKCSEPPDPAALLSQLKEGTPRCFHFLFQPSGQGAFIGASPERLFQRDEWSVETEAVAGSRPKGRSQSDDERLVRELLSSDKERREHEFVRVSLKEDMRPLVTELDLDADCSVMRLASARHLVSRMRASLRREVTSLDVLDAIHPSPAVGGMPSDLALQTLFDKEPFDRGWYAGPVGWIGPNRAEFAVGIRSGLVNDSQVRLYSGAGIVPGSTWQSEWDEIGDKIVDFSKVLGLVKNEASPLQVAAG